MNSQLPILGKTRKINVIGYAEKVPAKIDTGADSSAIWASNISIGPDNMLRFTLFGEGSPFYTGEIIERKVFKVAQVRSTTGHIQIRYRVPFAIRLGGKRILTLLNLSDRSKNKYPILIGRRTIYGKFLVDVQRGVKIEKMFDKRKLNKEMTKNPYQFYTKYHGQITKE